MRKLARRTSLLSFTPQKHHGRPECEQVGHSLSCAQSQCVKDECILGIAITNIVRVVVAASSRAVVSPFKGSNGSNTYFKDIMFAMFRTQLGNLDLAADRYMNEATSPMYLKYAHDNKFAPDSITLPSGTQAHWFGSSGAKKVLVYFHGMFSAVSEVPMLSNESRRGVRDAVWTWAYALAR